MKNSIKYLGMLILSISFFISCEVEPKFSTSELNAIEHNEAYAGHKRTCSHQKHMENLLSDPAYKHLHEKKFQNLQRESERAVSRNCADPLIIPVAVHFQSVSGTNSNCLRQLVESQIKVLNDDIRGLNNDIAKWKNEAQGFFPGISNGDACLKFCVATKNHPGGYGLSNGDMAITVNRVNGDFSNAWSGYLNIFVRPNLGFLGEAPLGGIGNGDGVLIDASTFGLGAGCGNVRPEGPYDLGRTTTHEVGHYFFLDHIWGNGCAIDDGINDTPDQDVEYEGCPQLGASSCGSNDLHMNYMDYSNDPCMYMFSAGQAQRMNAYTKSSLGVFLTKANSVCGEVNEPIVSNPSPTPVDDPIEETPEETTEDPDDNISEVPPTDNGNCQANKVELVLVLDDYGSETSWELVDEFGDRISIGGPFQDGILGQKVIEDFCLTDGCYTLYIDDSYGDGICCAEGNGRVRLKDETGKVIGRSNGKFGYYTYLDFCIQDGRSRFKGERSDKAVVSLARKR